MFTKTLVRLAEEKKAKVTYGSATKLNYREDQKGIKSVSYVHEKEKHELAATDVIIAAGPWTPKIIPSIQLQTPRGHSVVVRPTRDLSPHVLFPTIRPPENGSLENIFSPEMNPRPSDGLHDFETLYTCGPDDYEVSLPATSDDVAVDMQKCEDVWTAVKSVSGIIHDGEILTKQACYKPQIRKHEEDE